MALKAGLEETTAWHWGSAQWFPISLITLHSHALIMFIPALHDGRRREWGSSFMTLICNKSWRRRRIPSSKYRSEHVSWTDMGADGRQTVSPDGKGVWFPAMFALLMAELKVPSSTDLHHFKSQVHLHGAGGSCTQLFKSHSENMYMPSWQPQSGCAVLPLQPLTN